MSVRVFIVLLLCGSVAWANPTTQPATQPGVEATAQSTGGATTQPTTRQSRYPTAAELASKIKAIQEQTVEIPTVAHIDLDQPLLEKPADFSWFSGDEGLTLHNVLDRIGKATRDEDVEAILLTIGSTDFNLAQAQEVRRAMQHAKDAGKKIFVYADAYDTTAYTLATGATDICMLGGGEIMIPGIGIETMFARGLLDKIGVTADYVQIGEYKGADEQYTRTEASPQLREELNKLSDAMYAQIVDGISRYRALPRERVAALVDEALISANRAKEAGLVDHLTDPDGLREVIAGQYKQEKIDLRSHYGLPEREELDFSSIFSLMAALNKDPEPTDGPQIAIVYAEGMIIDGHGGESLFGDRAIGSDDIRAALRICARDEDIEAVVIRIDSPGGSALASEAMWQAVRRVAKDKPVVVSIGSMAASGGYYLASASDHIIADPTAVIGSIGVVGGKFVLKDLYGKLGLTTESYVRGANADLFSSSSPFSEKQRALVTRWMSQTYSQFTDRILATRKDKIAEIEQVARGRIFLAEQAMELGLVDQIGGLDEAIDYVADKAGLEEDGYSVRTVPAPATLADLFNGDPEAKSPIRPQVSMMEDSILRAVSPNLRSMLGQQVRALQLLQQRPVILVSPYVVRVR